MAIVGISRQCYGSQNNSTATGSGDRDFAAEFKRFIGFAFGNTTDIGFMKAINFMSIGFVFNQYAPGIQQGLSIRTNLFLGHLADQLTNQTRPFVCSLRTAFLDFSGSMLDKGDGG